MKYRLGDLCSIVSGSTPKTNVPEYWGGNLKWVTPAELSDDSYIVNDTVRKITELGVSKTALNLFPAGTVLLSSRAPIGKVAIAGCDMYCNQGFKNLICSSKIYNKYLFWFLKSKTDFLNSLGRGATFKEISKQIVSDIEIDLPDFEKQVKVSDIFEKISHLISLRTQQLEQLDLLIKSRFVEMFGDPGKNTKNWVVGKMGDYMTLLSDFSSNGGYATLDSNVKMKDEPDYAWMVRTTDLESDNEDNRKYIDEKTYNFLSKSKLQGNEIIMCKIGSAGKIYIMPNTGKPASLGRNAFMFRFNEKINRIFLYNLLTTEYGKNEINQYVRGAVTKTITKDDSRKIKIIVPPLELQNQFAAFVEEVEQNKATLKQSLEWLNTLKAKLMQNYFG